ncbi:MAG: YcxB family protein [Clostridia bacterium]|nr:YcxB family protein [Clostridia bacterium]
MKLSAATIYDKERLLRFSIYSSLKRRALWVMLILCTILVTAIYFYFGCPSFFDTIGLCFFLVLVIDGVILFTHFVLPSITIKQSPSLNARLTYDFGVNSIKLVVESQNASGQNEIFYTAIKQVMESKEDIYLFLSNQQAYVVDKSGFTEGSADELVAFLKEKGVPYKK